MHLGGLSGFGDSRRLSSFSGLNGWRRLAGVRELRGFDVLRCYGSNQRPSSIGTFGRFGGFGLFVGLFRHPILAF